MPDPMHFNSMAELYDRARPPYPEALWERMIALGVLSPGSRVLELGAGTGQATGRMIAEGAKVTAVEPGARLADLLRRRHPGAHMLETRAEEIAVEPASFDLVAIATAVHWMDLGIVLPRLHRALVPGGHLAVWRTSYGDGTAEPTPFRERVAAIVRRRGEVPRPDGGDEETAIWIPRLEEGGLFRVVDTHIVRWSVVLSSEQIRELFTTFSNWSAAEASEAEDAVRELGGSVLEHYLTALIVLERVDRVTRGGAPR